MNDTLIYLGDALHEMQNERGCAVLFTSSQGKLFEKELHGSFEKSIATTNKIRQELKKWHN